MAQQYPHGSFESTALVNNLFKNGLIKEERVRSAMLGVCIMVATIAGRL